MEELEINERPLKEFFKLFDTDEALEIIELGDVWHPSSGFVDETTFRHIKTVNDLLNTDYDFKGLVIFIAKIRGLSVDYHGGCYKITGDKKGIDKIKFNSLYRLNS